MLLRIAQSAELEQWAFAPSALPGIRPDTKQEPEAACTQDGACSPCTGDR